VWNASQNLGSLGSTLLDISVILGSILVLLAVSAHALRGLSAVAGTI
jgi:hypothetical protein